RCGCVAIADGEPADLAGRAQIAFHQGRREALHVGDVVEAAPDGVGRQVGVHVDVEAEQVADRARVLGAVEPLEGAPAWIRRQRGGGVEFGFEYVDERAERRRVGASCAGRGHHAVAQLSVYILTYV